MELFEEIRRGHAAGESIQRLAKKHGVHWRTVRQAMARAIPPERNKPTRERPKLGPWQTAIDQMMVADKAAHRKQRHTAHRIIKKIADQTGWVKEIAEVNVRNQRKFPPVPGKSLRPAEPT